MKGEENMKGTLIVTRQQLKKCHSNRSVITNTKPNEVQIDIKPIVYVLTQMILTGGDRNETREKSNV